MALSFSTPYQHLLVILLLVDGSLGDTVQIPHARGCDSPATLLLVDLEDTDLLESLDSLSVNSTGGVSVVGGAGAAVLGAAVDLPQSADTNGLAEVDVTGDSGSADVEPIERKRNRISV